MFNLLLIFGVALFASLSLSAFLKFKRYEKQLGENSAGVIDKKDVLQLFRPAMIFIVIAITAFCIYYGCGNADIATNGDQSFERFIQNVESGKQQLTTEKAIAIIQQERITEDAYRKVIAAEAWLVQWIGWLALIGFLLIIFFAFRVRTRSAKAEPNSALESAAK